MYKVTTLFRDGPTTYFVGESVSAANFDPQKLKQYVELRWLIDDGEEFLVDTASQFFQLEIHDGLADHDSEIKQ